MKNIIILMLFIFSITTLLAQKKHSVKLDGLFEYYSFYNYDRSYGSAASYEYQLSPRHSINTRLGWTQGKEMAYLNLPPSEPTFYNTETVKFIETTLTYRIYPHFIPKNRLKLGVGISAMSLKYNYVEESLVKGIYLFYLRKNTIHFNTILYHALFEDQYQINERWSIHTNVVFRVTRKLLPGYTTSSKHGNYGHISESYGTIAAHYAGNFVFGLGLGYSF